ncbi:uncharacterized protein FIBRA_00132 [Fibroporia radiculosa]|uniref:Rab-GAP TBC domain-containing protein n=1 Tax=Fibroporia radiculosa TaxID=599839 RepID=J7SCH5_9APHY|nr:uncharacterized protein FIBRA_00132 [Fibroporia radiculosa]CCL98138.1 predicted protein [Fibroporia radiculosa]
MDPPFFVVEPATSADTLRPPPSPLSSSSTTTNTPDLSSDDRERSSTETTIVTIYSMYEEDAGSWSVPPSLQAHSQYRSPKDGEVDVTVVGVDQRASTTRWTSRPIEDSAFFDTSEWPRTSLVQQPKHSGASHGSALCSYADDRPHSNIEPQTSHLELKAQAVPRNSSNGSLLSASRDNRPASAHSSRPSSTHTRLPVTTSGLPSSPRPPNRNTLTDSNEDSASVSSPPIPSSSYIEPAPAPSQHQSQRMLTPPSSPPRVSSVTGSPSSTPSIMPLPNEDPDGFHVRSTYAQLDVCGVRGDGYEEGVERTRARIGGSRASELAALEALGDAYEKTRELTSQELGMLSSLDRYGFYVTPSHDRIALLPVGPLLKPLVRVTTAVTNTSASVSLLPSLPSTATPSKELGRVVKWGRMLVPRSRDQGQNIDAWGINPSKEHKLRERTFKGIPDCWRSAAWDTLMCRFSKHGKMETTRLAQEYRNALDQASTYDVQIDLDVPRTISGHVMFRTRYGQGQRSLFHVLHCLSLHCETCGYCQGMGPIAATLLCYFEPERAYASLVRLHDAYQMHTIFSPGFPGLLEAIYVQERLTEQMLPAVYAAFKKHMVSTTAYATKWYITLFANSVPFQTQLRLWDAFLLEGHDIFVVVAVAIVWVYRDHITSNAASFETVLSLLSSFFVPEDENAFLAWVEKVIADKKLRSSMQHWRADWQRLVASGQHNQALL